ncbi:MAG: glycoside hydrolase family 9 protein [Bacteroidales bacterium]
MKSISLILVIAIALFLSGYKSGDRSKMAEIRINQLGYYPKAVKKVIVANTSARTFQITDTSGNVVYSGNLSQPVFWDKSGEKLCMADFSALTIQGTYFFKVEDASEPSKFSIKTNLYNDAFKAVLKNYYFQRSGMALEEKYAGKWNRPSGHPDTSCYFHPSALRGVGKMSSPKGWYDAGDDNKYVVNAGVSVGTILNLYEMVPSLVPDGFTNIPESGNKISDLLDEIKYELDWVLTMQTPDGGSNMKLTSKNFTGFIMPADDTTSRFVVGKGTGPSLNFAAMTAQAARIYKNIDTEFSKKCITAAEKAWNWSVKNPNVIYKNPSDIFTGEYGDRNFEEEFWWAACELYISTGKPIYLEFFNKNKPFARLNVGESWRGFIGNLGSFSLLLQNKGVPEELKTNVKSAVIRLADSLLVKQNSNPYRIFLDNFQWGSNSDILNSAMVFAYGYKLTGDVRYLDGILETTDYIFGKNATGYSFVTGFGSKSPMHIHHRASGADKIEDPIPGFVVGGPNYAKQDKGNGVNYSFNEPARSYMDVEASYASNEICINWNAPAVFVLGFICANSDKLN